MGFAMLMAGATTLGSCGGHGGTASPAAPRPETYGRGALASEATRTVEVRMLDSLRFEADRIAVHRGEVVTFHVLNAGRQPHEFTIGGADAQELHDDHMATMAMTTGSTGMTSGSMGMTAGSMDMTAGSMVTTAGSMGMAPGEKKHAAGLAKRIATLDRRAAASLSVHVPPGETRDVTWSFSGPRLPTFACHVPGHWKAGMQGGVTAS